MDLMVNYNFIVVVSWSFPLSIIDHAHDNVAPLLPKKSEDHFDSKGEFRYAPAVGSFVIWSWDNSKIHSLIFVFEQEITVISLLSPHPKRIFILSSSKFSKQKGEDDDSQRCFCVWLLCHDEDDDALVIKFTRRCYFFGAIYLSPKFTLAWVMTIR